MRLARSLLLAGSMLCISGPVAGVDHLTLVTVEGSTDTVVAEAIVTEAYRRLGIGITIKKYPGERALRLADHGAVDGEVQRIDAIKHKYKNLIQVSPPINYLEASAFTTSVELEPRGWEDLEPYSIGLIRGIKFAENNTVGMNRHVVSGYAPLFNMLDRGRFEIAVTPKMNGLFYIETASLDAIHALDPPIARFDLFHYLHRKHEGLVPRIAAVFADMEAKGELEAIRAHVIEVLLERAQSGLGICNGKRACPEMYLPVAISEETQ